MSPTTDPVGASTMATVALTVIVPVVVAGLTAVATMFVTRASAAADRRRDRYASAVETLAAWLEFPYRVRRRTDDAPATLSKLADLGHELQERLACHQAWIATEHPELANTYAATIDALSALIGPALNEAWEMSPCAKASDMNLGSWGPAPASQRALADLQVQIENRFGARRFKAWLRG
jgi:hypothetical protein